MLLEFVANCWRRADHVCGIDVDQVDTPPRDFYNVYIYFTSSENPLRVFSSKSRDEAWDCAKRWESEINTVLKGSTNA